MTSALPAIEPEEGITGTSMGGSSNSSSAGSMEPETNTFGPPVFAAVTTELVAIDVLCQSGTDLTRENVLGAITAINRPTSILGQAISFAPSGDLIGGRFFFFEIQEDGTKTAIGG